MQKPTSALNLEIIQFVMRDPRVAKRLNARDNDSHTRAVSLYCRFVSQSRRNPENSFYLIEFVYQTERSNLDHIDDIRVSVEVIEGNPPRMHIHKIQEY